MNNDNPFMNPDWMGLQQQYLQALSAFYPDPGEAGARPDSQRGWNEALDYWLNSVKDQVPSQNRPVFEAMVRQSRVFYAMTDQFATMIKAISSADDNTGDWQAIMTGHFDGMKSMLDNYSQGGGDYSQAPGFMWSFPAESWQQLMNGMSVLPDSVFARLAEQGIEAFTEKLVAMPGLGMTRELQEKLQQALHAWVEYQHHSQRYNEVFARLGKAALDRLQENILKKADNAEKISSLRQIYNMWIEANEDVFAGFVYSEEYARLYGDLVNALTAFRRQSNELADDLLAVLNVPTSAGVNTVTRRQHQMRNELRASLEMQRQTAAALEAVRAELHKLQTELRTVTKQDKKAAVGKDKTPRKKSITVKKPDKGRNT